MSLSFDEWLASCPVLTPGMTPKEAVTRLLVLVEASKHLARENPAARERHRQHNQWLNEAIRLTR